MTLQVRRTVPKQADRIQQRLTNYACDLNYASLSAEAIHATKARVIDTLGALIGGFYGEPCRIGRDLAAQVPNPDGATVIGTRMKTTPDMAAFVNGTTARYVEMNDAYHRPGVFAGHPSDVLTPVLAAAEHVRASGREFIVGVALAYEVHLRIADTVQIPGFDYTNFVSLGTAVAAGKLFGLSPDQLSHCISMAVVPNNALLQSRTGHLTMFKAVAAGQAGRAGVFAALLARAGMEGPHLPFEGQAGWCTYVSRMPFSLDTMGGKGIAFRVEETLIKPRASCGTTQSSILAAEKIALRGNTKGVKQVIVEVYKEALHRCGTGEQHWSPDSRETADHSIPYVVAATLMHGTVTPRQFNDTHIWNSELRALMQKIEVVENEEFTKAYGRLPVEHRTRVTVVTNDGDRLMGETGGSKGDVATPMSDAQIEEKFRGLSEEFLGTKRADTILDRLWHLEDCGNVAEIPAHFVLG